MASAGEPPRNRSGIAFDESFDAIGEVDLLQQIGIGFEFGRALGRGTLEAAGLARDVVDDAIHDESERAQNQDDNDEHREAPRHEPREVLDGRLQERGDRHRGQGPRDRRVAASSAISRTRTVTANANTSASAERNDSRTP